MNLFKYIVHQIITFKMYVMRTIMFSISKCVKSNKFDYMEDTLIRLKFITFNFNFYFFPYFSFIFFDFN